MSIERTSNGASTWGTLLVVALAWAGFWYSKASKDSPSQSDSATIAAPAAAPAPAPVEAAPALLPSKTPYSAAGVAKDGFIFRQSGECATSCYFRLSGPIVPGVAEAILTQLRPIANRPISVVLNSPGGDMHEAMRLGRIFRAHQIAALVGVDMECSSACVLLLASGVQRLVYLGRVGIHSPYMDAATEGATFQQFQQEHDKLGGLVRTYLGEMNITPELFDRMRTVPSDEMLYLEPADLDRFGLAGSDPVWADFKASQAAAKANLSKADYLAREARRAAALKACYVREDVVSEPRGGPKESQCAIESQKVM